MTVFTYLLYIVGNNAARTIGGEYVPHILSLYNDWHQADTKHRHVSIRKGLLNVLKNITNLSKYVLLLTFHNITT